MAERRGEARATASRRSRSSRRTTSHAPVAEAFLEAGIHVICDKPLATHVARRAALAGAARRKPGQIFAVTYNYTGYPMVRQARRDGRGRRARRDPRRAGRVCAGLADRAAREAPARSRPTGAPTRRGRAPAAASATSARTPTTSRSFVTGLTVDALCADLTHLRRRAAALDDNAQILLRYRERRARHALGEPGRAGQRERAAPPRLRQPGAASNGSRSSRTICAGRRSASRRRSSRAAPRRPTRTRRASRACRPAIRRATSKASRRSTARSRRRSAPRAAVARRPIRPFNSRRSTTASPASPSSRPRSRHRQPAAPGSRRDEPARRLRWHQQGLRRRARAARRRFELDAGPGLRPARRERRRQVDADEDPLRLRDGERRRVARSTASPVASPVRATPRPRASC